ncbi:MAG: hypothetical protein ISN64_02870 [Rickettsia sp.]|nr:hypothetical protein [Rickettsia sp.]
MVKYIEVRDFLKITHHYDFETLVSRDLELLQVIKIENPKHFISQYNSELKKNIRNILQEVASENTVFYIHNKFSKFSFKKENFTGNFLGFMDDFWIEQNQLDNIFLNEIYISVLYRTDDIFSSKVERFIQSFFTKILFKRYLNQLKIASKKINNITEKIINCLTKFNAKKLTSVPTENGYKSELLIFYYELVNFTKIDFYVTEQDISNINNLSRFYFGKNVINSRIEKKEFFATVISIKNLLGINEEMLEKISQLNIQLTIASTIFFSSESKNFNLKKQLEYLKITSSKKLEKFMGLSNFETNDKFFEEQQILVLYEQNLQKLLSNASLVQDLLSSLGITYVIEDINLEKQFWSYLPSNTSFITRKNLLLGNEIANFVHVRSPIIPNLKEKKKYFWGKNIITFKSINKLFYNFSFYDQNNNSNILLLGSKESGKTILVNLLLARSQKFFPNIGYLTLSKDSHVFVGLLGGKFYSCKKLFNPFLIGEGQIARDFLFEWFKILSLNVVNPLNNNEMELIGDFINSILELNTKDRAIHKIFQLLNTNKNYSALAKRLEYLTIKKDYLSVFEGDNSSFQAKDVFQLIDLNFPSPQHDSNADVQEIHQFRAVRAAVLYSYFSIFLLNFAKQEKILVIDQIGQILYLKHYSYLLDKIKASPIVLIVTMNANKNKFFDTKSSEQNSIKTVFDHFLKNFETKIFFFLEIEGFVYKYFQNRINKLRRFLNISAEEHKILLVQNGYEIIVDFKFCNDHLFTGICSSGSKERSIFNLTLQQVENKEDLNEIFLLFCQKLLAEEEN